jgi:hypothetical protein
MKHIEKKISINRLSCGFALIQFEEKDRRWLKHLYGLWVQLSKDLKSLSRKGIHSRTINLPEVISESAFCLNMNCFRKGTPISYSSASTSFDCLDKRGRLIQVKASSVHHDLTSFGPRSKWDKLYYCDFYRRGKWDGTFDIYLIPNGLIYDHKVGHDQSFRQQQAQGRRPRLSIMREIIEKKKMKPIKVGYI